MCDRELRKLGRLKDTQMQVNIDTVLCWMEAIRNSRDPHRTLEAFWRGQMRSKIWLCEIVSRYGPLVPGTVDIFGGWIGTLASIMTEASDIIPGHIRSIDIDPDCEEIARTINMPMVKVNRFEAITADMCDFKSDAELVVNTSCEHITQEQYDRWLSNMSNDSFIVLQSNNYVIDEHIRIANSLEHFKEQSNIETVFEGTLELPLYDRYMLMGRKRV